jgi:antitoxin (DNA-binding transcriptional repressor) of toxin-antitoxin stability system
MKRIDLDDMPPKLAALLAGAEDGEEILLVQGGAVVGRLTGHGRSPSEINSTDPQLSPNEHAKEIFEQFRSTIEDEF